MKTTLREKVSSIIERRKEEAFALREYKRQIENNLEKFTFAQFQDEFKDIIEMFKADGIDYRIIHKNKSCTPEVHFFMPKQPVLLEHIPPYVILFRDKFAYSFYPEEHGLCKWIGTKEEEDFLIDIYDHFLNQ